MSWLNFLKKRKKERKFRLIVLRRESLSPNDHYHGTNHLYCDIALFVAFHMALILSKANNYT